MIYDSNKKHKSKDMKNISEYVATHTTSFNDNSKSIRNYLMRFPCLVVSDANRCQTKTSHGYYCIPQL